MRKLILFLQLFLCFQFILAQRSSFFISEDRLFNEGKAMYNDENYAGCIDKLKEYRKKATDINLIQETDFYLLASSYRQGHENVMDLLKNFLDEYPETRHADAVCFMIGSCHFVKEDYNKAIYWLDKSEIDNLSGGDQDDYAYRMAYACLKTNRKDNAMRLFGLLKENSKKYKNAATYYTAYLYYQDGDYERALPLFTGLKEDKEFRSDAIYYLTQINFIRGRYAQTIKEGRELLRDFPDHQNNQEINRMIGVSYFYEDNYLDAVKYLSAYVDSEKSPLRTDMYILGLSYYQLNNYGKAVEFLSKSIRENDAIAQNAYLYIGHSYLNLNDNKNASLAFEAASRMNFDQQLKEASMYNYAVLLHQMSPSAFGESVTVLENFLNEYPNSRYTDKINDCLVEVYLTTRNYDTALKSIEKIKNPSGKIQEARQKIYYHLGTVYFTNTDFDNAINYFTKAINAGNYAVAEKEKSIYWRGESYYRKEDYLNAIQDYKSYLNLQRNGELDPLANYGLGYAYFNRHQYSFAQNFLNQFIKTDRDNRTDMQADAYARIGDCNFYERNFKAAENAYSRSASLQPSTADYTIYQKGFIQGLQKDYKGKISQMDLLISSYPDSRYVPDALYEKGRSYVMMDQSAAAIKTFEQLFKNYPQNVLARKAGVQIGLLYYDENELQKSVNAYKQVVEKYPGSEEAKVAIQDLKSVYVDMNDISGYAQYVNSLGGTVKFEISEQDSLTYIAAERFFMRGDVSQAESAMKKYLQNFPEGAFNINAHFYLGNIYYNNNQKEAAKNEFEKVVTASDNKFTEGALVHLSEIQSGMKEYESALRSYQRLLNVAGSRENKDIALLGIMRSGYHLGNYAVIINASNDLLKEPKLDPGKKNEAIYYRAKALIGSNEWSKAESDLKVLAEDTRTAFGAEAKYLLAQYYFDNNEPGKAETEMSDYIKKGTPHAYWLARGFILLSDIYMKQGDNLQARQYLESLQYNYSDRNNDDIHTMINERLNRIKQENN